MQKSSTTARGLKSYAAPVAPTFSSAPVLEALEDRKLMTSTYDIGINVNDASSAAVSKMVPVLKNLGVKTVRLWYSIKDTSSRTIDGALNRAKDYSDAGFDVDMVIHTKNGVNAGYANFNGWFDWAADNSYLKQYIDHWEIGNEPDHAEYWQGSLSSYVNDFLKPAYANLHAAGEEVISAAPSWNANDVQTMINAGMLNYCDYVGFHPYATGADGVKASVAAINKVVAGRKPIAATEWSIRGIGDRNAWAAAVKDVFPTIKSGFALNYYFAAKTQNSMAGPGGLLNSDWSYNTPFYNAFSTFKYAGGTTNGGVVTSPMPTPSPTPTPTPTPTGNTPSGTGSIYGTLFDDADGDGNKDAWEKNSSGTFTVFLDTNDNGLLDWGEKTSTTDASGNYAFTGLGKGTYEVGAVLPNGFCVSTDTGTVSTNVASGGKNVNVNVGVAKGSTSYGGSGGSSDSGSGNTSGAPAVTGLQLLNASTGEVIGTYTKNQYIALSSLPTRNIAVAAAVTGGVAAVKLEGLGKTVVETSAPFTLLGDSNNGKSFNGLYAGPGSYTFGLTAVGSNGQSTATSYLSITFY